MMFLLEIQQNETNASLQFTKVKVKVFQITSSLSL